MRDIDETEFNSVFKTGLSLATIVGLNGGKFLWAIDWFIMKDSIQFKGKFEAWNEDVEFTIDGIFPVEVKFDGRIENGELFG